MVWDVQGLEGSPSLDGTLGAVCWAWRDRLCPVYSDCRMEGSSLA